MGERKSRKRRMEKQMLRTAETAENITITNTSVLVIKVKMGERKSRKRRMEKYILGTAETVKSITITNTSVSATKGRNENRINRKRERKGNEWRRCGSMRMA
jgi:hypothetical protein